MGARLDDKALLGVSSRGFEIENLHLHEVENIWSSFQRS